MTRNVKGSIKLEPGSAPTASKGVMYFDSTANEFKGSEDGSTFSNLGGGGAISGVLQLVEEITISSAVTTQDFASSLDGDTDGAYIFEGRLVNDGGSDSNYSLRLNGATIACNKQYVFVSGSSISGFRGTSPIFQGINAGLAGQFRLELPKTKTGDTRHILGSTGDDTTIVEGHFELAFYLTTPNNSTNITSMGVTSSAANGIGVGSILRLWKRVT